MQVLLQLHLLLIFQLLLGLEFLFLVDVLLFEILKNDGVLFGAFGNLPGFACLCVDTVGEVLFKALLKGLVVHIVLLGVQERLICFELFLNHTVQHAVVREHRFELFELVSEFVFLLGFG